MRLSATTLLFLSTILLAAPVPKQKVTTVEEKIRGKWKMVASQGQPTPASTFHIVFLKDCELEFRNEGNGKAVVYAGTYKVSEPSDEHKLGTIDWKITQNGVERGELSQITELTESVLEFKDPAGLVERFERVKEDKNEK